MQISKIRWNRYLRRSIITWVWKPRVQKPKFLFSCRKNISLVCCAHSWNIFQHSKRNFVSLCGHVISSIYYSLRYFLLSDFFFFTCFYRLRKQTRGKFIEFDLSFVVSVFTDITERVKMNMQWCPSCFSGQDLQQLPTGCTETFFKIFLCFPRAAILTVAYIVYLRSEFDLWVLSFD